MPNKTSCANWGSFAKPNPKSEEWKYLNLDNLFNKDFKPARGFALDIAKIEKYFLPDCYCIVVINGMVHQELSTIGFDFEDFESVDRKIHLLFFTTTEQVYWNSNFTFNFGRCCSARIFEQHVSLVEGEYFSNPQITINCDEGCYIIYHKLQQENAQCYHIANQEVFLGADATYRHYNFSFGGVLTRNDINVHLNGTGSRTELKGVYYPIKQQQIDNHTVGYHNSPRTISCGNYRGIMQDQGYAVFNGKIVVAVDAQKTEARLSNKNLVLSNQATINTKPELQIFADDVKCSHGATIGALDEDALFLLRARGINTVDAKNILQYAHLAEIMAEVYDQQIVALINAELISRMGNASIIEECSEIHHTRF